MDEYTTTPTTNSPNQYTSILDRKSCYPSTQNHNSILHPQNNENELVSFLNAYEIEIEEGLVCVD